MEEYMQSKIDNFDNFIIWLEKDGLKAKKSERLWKKKIFTNLLNNEIKTIDNYNDFLVNKKLRSIINKDVQYKKISSKISNVETTCKYFVLTTTDSSVIKVKKEDFNIFIKEFIKEN